VLTPFVVKSLAAKAIARPGLPRLLHKIFLADKLAIVTYHGIIRSPLTIRDWCFLDEDSFRTQAAYLKRHFDVLPLSAAVEALRHGKINRPTAAITFDDGYHNNYSIAFPILREFSLPATIFLTTALIDTGETLWHLRLHRSLSKTTKNSLEWNGRRLDLAGTASRAKANGEIKNQLAALPHPELFRRLRGIVGALGDEFDEPIETDSPFRMLNTEAIDEMIASGLIEFGAHTHSHPILSRLSRGECQDEIERSIEAVRKLTGHPCELFAYPFGGQNDYNQNAIDCLRSLGIPAAVTTLTGPNDKDAPLLELRRYGAGAGEDMSVFQFKVHHLMPRRAEAR
jgi:peptidoglycan/xylan/chitin deacetylase (PgdA/CDA1 family)